MRRPLDTRIVATIVERVPDFPDPIDAELKSTHDLVVERIEAAEHAIALGEQPNATDATIRTMFRELTAEPVHPPVRGILSDQAQYLLVGVGETVAEHPDVLASLEALAADLRARGQHEHVSAEQARELLRAAGDGTLPDELDAEVRRVWSICWNGVPTPARDPLDAQQANAQAVGAGGMDGFSRAAEIEANAINLGRGQGIVIRHVEGVPDSDAYVLDPRALKRRSNFPVF